MGPRFLKRGNVLKHFVYLPVMQLQWGRTFVRKPPIHFASNLRFNIVLYNGKVKKGSSFLLQWSGLET